VDQHGWDRNLPGKGHVAVDEGELHGFLATLVADLGACARAANVVVGDQLGLYKALADAGPVSPVELAARTGTAVRYLSQWLAGQASGGYVTHDPASGRYRLTDEQAFALADEHSPAYLPGAFRLATAGVQDGSGITQAFRSAGRAGLIRRDPDMFDACEPFFRPAYAANLVDRWIPGLDGVHAKLRQGARVADVGCGRGAGTILLAKAYPSSTFAGFDDHRASVEAARRAAADAGVGERVSFQVTGAGRHPGRGYDLVCSFDCLYDADDPVGVAAHLLASLAGDGTWLLVEPFADDRIHGDLNPAGRAYLLVSALLCGSDGSAPDAGAGEARLRRVVAAAGGSRFRRAAGAGMVFLAQP
jgi:SAM-dependent methyltransferase